MSKVINVRVSNIRPTYNNLKEWCEDKQNYYIGRKGIVFIDGKRYPEKDSIFHNPFKIVNNNRNDVLRKYKKYIKERLANEEKLLIKLMKLKNKILGCWCYPEKCHGNILISIIKNHRLKIKEIKYEQQIEEY